MLITGLLTEGLTVDFAGATGFVGKTKALPNVGLVVPPGCCAFENMICDLTGPSPAEGTSANPRRTVVDRIWLVNTGTICSEVLFVLESAAGFCSWTLEVGFLVGTGAICSLGAVLAEVEVFTVTKSGSVLVAEFCCDELTARFGRRFSANWNK